MLFNSFKFVVFLLCTAILYRLIPQKFRRVFLLLVSYGYYALWNPVYCALLLLVSLLGWKTALLIDAAEGKKRNRLCSFGVVTLVLLLCFFKLGHLFADALYAISAGSFSFNALAAPLGISYYSFSLIGYLCDVKNKKTAAEKDLLTAMLFVSFFPQIMAGPIARANELMPQLKEPKSADYSDFVLGAQRFLKGAFIKCVLADGLAILINGYYSSPAYYDGLVGIAIFVALPIYLYADFSGYSDMALGCARMLGFNLCENFAAPYLSSTMGEFWGRWHISLSSWLRDYIYFPMGGSRCGAVRAAFNLVFVFVVSGIWHGVSVNYLIWGLMLGIYRVIERNIGKKWGKIDKTKRRIHARALLLLVWSVSLIFFKAATPADPLAVVKSIFGGFSVKTALLQLLALAQCGGKYTTTWHFVFFFVSLLFAMVLCVCFDVLTYKGKPNALGEFGSRGRMALYIAMSIVTVLFYFLTLSAGGASFVYLGY